MYEESPNRQKQVIATLAVLIVIVVIVAGAVYASSSKQEEATTNAATSTTATENVDQSAKNATQANTRYADGNYDASSRYSTPGGTDTMDISVTLQNGSVIAVGASTSPQDAESKEYDNNFLDEFKTFVIGKNIEDVQLSRIAGASLTTGGFMDALESVADQARS